MDGIQNSEFEEITKYSSFEDMNLKDTLLRGIFSYGFEKPSAIQSKAIVPILKNNDVIAQSQSGTGKTGTFVISTLQKIDDSVTGCQAMIIAHTKELARQIHGVCSDIGKYEKVTPVLCTGGLNIYDAKNELRKGPTIVIGTPGRIIDMINRGFLSMRSLRLLILDEADEMLSPGFQNQIRQIVEEIPPSTQICIFSATLPRFVLDITKKFMNKPLQIRVKIEELTLEGIQQFYINVEKEANKFETFCDLYGNISVSQSIVYVNTKRKADWLKSNLEAMKFTISVIHSDLSPTEREKIMHEYRNGETRILISTDLLSRGIDVQQVSVVINYDMPNNKECYLHRIGRSGRYGRKGTAINLVTDKDSWKIEELETFYQTQIDEMPINIKELL